MSFVELIACYCVLFILCCPTALLLLWWAQRLDRENPPDAIHHDEGAEAFGRTGALMAFLVPALIIGSVGMPVSGMLWFLGMMLVCGKLGVVVGTARAIVEYRRRALHPICVLVWPLPEVSTAISATAVSPTVPQVRSITCAPPLQAYPILMGAIAGYMGCLCSLVTVDLAVRIVSIFLP